MTWPPAAAEVTHACHKDTNLGGSIGIASIMSFLVRGTQVHQNYLVANVTLGTPAVAQRLQGIERGTSWPVRACTPRTRRPLGMLYGLAQHQASLFAYVDNFLFRASSRCSASRSHSCSGASAGRPAPATKL